MVYCSCNFWPHGGCPHCGYCPYCGRGYHRPPVVIQPPVIVQPPPVVIQPFRPDYSNVGDAVAKARDAVAA